MRMPRTTLALIILWFVAPVSAQTPLVELAPEARAQRQAQDLTAVLRYRQGLRDTLAYIGTRPEIFPPVRPTQAALLPAADRDAARRLWQRWLDYYLALDSSGRYHDDFAALADARDRERSFRVSYLAFVGGYRAALEFIDAAERNPGLDALLNEPLPELGLPARSYDRFKLRFLNVARATEFATLEALRQTLTSDDAATQAIARDDAAAIWRAGRGRGHALTAKNALDIIRKTGFTAWFPVQAGVAEWMGDAKVYRVHRSLVSAAQIAAMMPQLEPGDILLERREWYLSNVGLPGFWPHAAIYIGTPQERARYFDDADVRAWVQRQGEPSGALDSLLRARYAPAYARSLVPQEHEHVARVIEAISEGVSFTTLEHSADADSVAVLRPRLAKVEKAAALVRAFGYAGRPYDFDFDFRTDSALVCTELVYKAYEPGADSRGLTLPLVEVLGRPATPANEMVRQFDAQYGTPAQQTELVLFLDGQERQRRAVSASLDEFRNSWRRPKWHVWVQESPPASAKAAP